MLTWPIHILNINDFRVREKALKRLPPHGRKLFKHCVFWNSRQVYWSARALGANDHKSRVWRERHRWTSIYNRCLRDSTKNSLQRIVHLCSKHTGKKCGDNVYSLFALMSLTNHGIFFAVIILSFVFTNTVCTDRIQRFYTC